MTRRSLLKTVAAAFTGSVVARFMPAPVTELVEEEGLPGFTMTLEPGTYSMDEINTKLRQLIDGLERVGVLLPGS